MASHTQILPSPAEKPLDSARQQFAEAWAIPAVNNARLFIALLVVGTIAAASIASNFQIRRSIDNFKPRVIRIDEVGRAQALDYVAMAYKPQAPEIKYFLTQFVHDYYSRNRATVRDAFARSLFFLDSRLAGARMDEARKSKEIQNFMVNSGEEIEVHIQNIVLQDVRTPPFRATVDFDKVYLSGSERIELRRESYVGSFLFRFADTVSNNMIPVNPLGLTILYFRDDQAFKEVKP